jgi:hypothetical protein
MPANPEGSSLEGVLGGLPRMTGGAPQPPGQNDARMGGLTMPAKPSGELEMAKVNVQIAMTLMEQVLPLYGSGSDEGGAIIKALQSLSKDFGKQSAEDLSSSQLMNMFSQIGGPPPGGGGPMPPGGMAVGQGGGPPGGGGLPPELMQMLMGRQ